MATPDATAPEQVAARIAQARRWVAVREARDVTQTDIARRLGTTQATVNRWERGEATPQGPAFRLLSLILGVGEEWLRSGQGAGPAELYQTEAGRVVTPSSPLPMAPADVVSLEAVKKKRGGATG